MNHLPGSSFHNSKNHVGALKGRGCINAWHITTKPPDVFQKAVMTLLGHIGSGN